MIGLRSVLALALVLFPLSGFQNFRPRGAGSDLAVGVSDCAQNGSITGGIATASLSTTAGSTVLLGVSYTTFGGGFESVSGSADATGWTQVGTTQTVTGLGESRLYYKPNITGGSQTFTLDVVGDFATICAVEILGAGASSLDTGSATADAAEPYTGTALSTTAANTVLVAFFGRAEGGVGDANAAESTGFALQDEAPNCSALMCADIWTRIVSPSGSYNTSSTDDGTDAGSTVHLAAIKD